MFSFRKDLLRFRDLIHFLKLGHVDPHGVAGGGQIWVSMAGMFTCTQDSINALLLRPMARASLRRVVGFVPLSPFSTWNSDPTLISVGLLIGLVGWGHPRALPGKRNIMNQLMTAGRAMNSPFAAETDGRCFFFSVGVCSVDNSLEWQSLMWY